MKPKVLILPSSTDVTQTKANTYYDSTKFIEEGQDPKGKVLLCPEILDGKPSERQICSKRLGCKNVEDYYFNLRVKMKVSNYMGMWTPKKPIKIKKELGLVAVEAQELELISSENEQSSENEETVAYSNQTPNGWMANSNQVQNSPASGTPSEYTGLGIEEEQYSITGKKLEKSDSESSFTRLKDLPVDQTDAKATPELRINVDMIPGREDNSVLDKLGLNIQDTATYTDDYNDESLSASYKVGKNYEDPGDLIDFKSLPNSPIRASKTTPNLNHFQYDNTELDPNSYEITQSEDNINQLTDSRRDTLSSDSTLNQISNSESELELESGTGNNGSGRRINSNLNVLSNTFNRIAQTRSLPDLSKPPADDQPVNDPYLKFQSQPNLSSSRSIEDNSSSSKPRRPSPPSGDNSDSEDNEDEPSAELEEFLADGKNDEDE